jgi:hypothetical protein
MFRWTQMLQKLFASSGIRTHRPPIRRARPTEKLRLESLEERDLPSASTLAAPTFADVATQMVSSIEQSIQQTVTLESDAINAWRTLAQGVVGEVASIQQQWD